MIGHTIAGMLMLGWIFFLHIHVGMLKSKVSDMNKSSISELRNMMELTKLVKELERRLDNLPAELELQINKEGDK